MKTVLYFPALRKAWPDILLLLLCILVSTFIHIWIPYDHVFLTDGTVRFVGIDSWYHVRLMDHLLENYPYPLTFDPYAIFPNGQSVPVSPFFDWLVVSLTLLFSGGTVSTPMLETVAAFMPPVMAAAVIVPVYFITKQIFGRLTALLAAGLIAVQGGSFILRTILGFSDHHAAEILFSVMAMAGLMSALAAVKKPNITAGLHQNNAGRIWQQKQFVPVVFTGLSLGAYLLTWSGGALLISMILVWVILQATHDFVVHTKISHLTKIIVPCAAIALLTLLPFWNYLPQRNIHLFALLLLAGLPLLFQLNQRLSKTRLYPKSFFIGLFALQVLLVTATMLWLQPTLLNTLLNELGRFAAGIRNTVGEATPMLTVTGEFSLWPIIEGYGWVFFLGLFGLLLLTQSLIKEYTAQKALLLIWCSSMFLVTFAQNRFGYYLAVNISILTAFVCSQVLALATTSPAVKSKVGGNKAPKGKALAVKGSAKIYRTLAIFIVAGLAYYPSVVTSVFVARTDLGPPVYWMDTLKWLRTNTPEPIVGDMTINGKSKLMGPLTAAQNSSYGVLSWWDYGYWITRIGQRIPNANPTQNGAKKVARYFTETDPHIAQTMISAMGSRYVMIDASMLVQPNQSTKMSAIIRWAERNVSDYYEAYRIPGSSEYLLAYKPSYYQSMVTRLYQFGGKKFTPKQHSWILAYEFKRDAQGKTFKSLLAKYQFGTYQEALAFKQANPKLLIDLVGLDPRYSCVPLEKLPSYGLLYQSGLAYRGNNGRMLTIVKLKTFSWK